MPRAKSEPVTKTVTGRHAEPIEVVVRPKGRAPASKAPASKAPVSKAPASTEPARKASRTFKAAAEAAVAATQGALAALEALLHVRRPDALEPEGEAAHRVRAMAQTAPAGATAGGADGEISSTGGAPAVKRSTEGVGSLTERLYEAVSRREGAVSSTAPRFVPGQLAAPQPSRGQSPVEEVAKTLGACWTTVYAEFHAKHMLFDDAMARKYVLQKVKVASWCRDVTYPYIILEVADVPMLFVLPAAKAISAATPYIASLYEFESLPKEGPPTFHSAAVVAPGRLAFPPDPAACTRGRVTLGLREQATQVSLPTLMDVAARPTLAESTVHERNLLERHAKRLAEVWSDVFARMYRDRSALNDDAARVAIEKVLGATRRWARSEQQYIAAEWRELPYCFVLPAVRSPSETTPHLVSFYWIDRILAPSSAPRFETVAAVPRGSLHFPPTFGTLTMGRMSLAR